MRGLLAPPILWIESTVRWLVAFATDHRLPAGAFTRSWRTGSSVLWVTLLLAALLIVYYLEGD